MLFALQMLPRVTSWYDAPVSAYANRYQALFDSLDEGFACFDTADYREGVDAFLNKRKPDFRGR